MVERGVILAPNGTRIEVNHLFSPCSEEHAREFGVDVNGALGVDRGESGKSLCEAVFNGVLTLDQVETMLLEKPSTRRMAIFHPRPACSA